MRPLGVPLLLALVFMFACTPPVPAQVRDIEVSNQTTLAVTLVVNGSALRTFPPGAIGAIRVSDLPALPWIVEARAPSGRVLTSMAVRAGDISETSRPDGVRVLQGAAARVELSCGRLDLWSGPPMLGPMAGTTGKPGDCDP